MRYLKYALRRIAIAIGSVYLVVTGTLFALYPVMEGWVAAKIEEIRHSPFYKLTQTQENRLVDSVRTAYDVDESLPERLLDWWLDVPTFDWGVSVIHQEPVVAVLDDRVLRTLGYVLPGLLVAILLGVLVGVTVAITRNRLVDWGARLTTYAVLGVPVFMLLYYLQYLAGAAIGVPGGEIALPAVGQTTLAAIAIALAVVAGQVRFARASALEQTGRDFVKTLRAKGIDRLRLARHVLRNLAVPLLSLSLAELFGTLVIAVYVVEAVLGIDGLAAVSLAAAKRADLPLVVGSTLVIVYLGIAARLVQDLLAGYLDPRLRSE